MAMHWQKDTKNTDSRGTMGTLVQPGDVQSELFQTEVSDQWNPKLTRAAACRSSAGWDWGSLAIK